MLQNKAARVVCKVGIYTPVRTLLSQCSWLSVNQLIFFHTVMLTYKTIKKQCPSFLYNMIDTRYEYRTRACDAGFLRQTSEYRPDHELNLKSYRWRSIRYWNLLPADIRTCQNLSSFKIMLKTWVQKNVDIYP